MLALVERRPVVVSIKSKFQRPFVVDDTGRLEGALLVRPAPAIDRQPPLQGEPSPIAERAAAQHAILVRTLADFGVATVVAEGTEASPLSALVADTAVVLRDGAILMRPSALARSAEVAAVEALLVEAQIPVIGRIEPPGILDGGDVLIGGDDAYIGVQTAATVFTKRSNAAGRQQFAELARGSGIARVVEVAHAPRLLRLRSAAAIVAPETVVLAPDLVDAFAFHALDRIEVPRGEELAAGVLPLGARRLIANLRFRTALPDLRKRKFAVAAIDLWEFGKVGATPPLLALALKRS